MHRHETDSGNSPALMPVLEGPLRNDTRYMSTSTVTKKACKARASRQDAALGRPLHGTAALEAWSQPCTSQTFLPWARRSETLGGSTSVLRSLRLTNSIMTSAVFSG